MPADPTNKYRRIARLSQGFTPARPVNKADLFAGREEQISGCISAIFQDGLHIVVYGERGVGKTSLANVLPEIISSMKHPTLGAARIDCSTTTDYDGLWFQACRDLGAPWPDHELVEPEAIRHHLAGIAKSLLIVFDELDRFRGQEEALAKFADTIKTLSDHDVDATLMLVGVADSVDGLIGNHASIVRCLMPIEMPRMRPDECRAILERGYAFAEMSAAPKVQDEIIHMAEGLPHFVHMLGLNAGKIAAEDDRDDVTESDLLKGIGEAIKNHVVMSQYKRATDSPQPGHLYEKVLFACALAEKNEFGEFRASDVSKPLALIMGKERVGIPTFARHLTEFSTPSRGAVLMKLGSHHNHRYRFQDPFLQPFAKLVALKTGLATPQVIAMYGSNDEIADPIVKFWPRAQPS
jgi:energy-coupling factor transporter ATP-binding protein EcfA2